MRAADLLLLTLLVPPGLAHARPDAGCLVAWQVAGAEAAGRTLVARCEDGDAACDIDGAADGTCTFGVTLCLNPPAAGCAPGTLDEVALKGGMAAPLADAVGALARPIASPACTGATPVSVALGRRGRRRLRGAAVVRDRGASRTGRAGVRLVCRRRPPGTAAPRAVVVTTDFETGVLSTLRVEPPRTPTRLAPQIHPDAVVRTADGLVYVVNRFLGDTLQVLDPARGFTTRLQCSTGPRSNPHDVAVVGPRKAYVTRYGEPALWAVDPGARSCAGFLTRAIDLGGLADGDGIPEMDQAAVVGDRLFVTLARLDRGRRFAPAGRSRLAVVDTATDTLAGVVELQGRNAFGDSAGLPRAPDTGHLVVAQAGNIYVVGDGGLELVDPFALASRGWLVTEDELGGNITDFVLVSARKGYAIVVDAALTNVLVAFDPETRTVTRRLLARQEYLPDLALAPDGTLWVADRTLLEPGIRLFDTADDTPLTARAVALGLPPFSIGFLP